MKHRVNEFGGHGPLLGPLPVPLVVRGGTSRRSMACFCMLFAPSSLGSPGTLVTAFLGPWLHTLVAYISVALARTARQHCPFHGRSVHAALPPSVCSQEHAPGDLANPGACFRMRLPAFASAVAGGPSLPHPFLCVFVFVPATPPTASMHHLLSGKQSDSWSVVWISIGQRYGVLLSRFISFPLTIMADSKEGTKPVETFRKRGVSVSIFANDVKDKSRPMYKVAMQRTYKDGDEFKHSTSFNRDDLPVVRLLLDKAYETIMELEEKDWRQSSKE